MSEANAKFDDFLRAEFEHLASSLAGNEDAGEKRVTMFLSLTTGIGAVLVFAGDKLHGVSGASFLPLVLFVLIAWLLVGIATLQRLIRRNLVTQDYLRGMRRIRRHFAAGVGPDLRNVLPFDPFGKVPVKERQGWGLGTGGFAEMVSLLNAIVAGTVGCVWTAVFVFDVTLDAPLDDRTRRILMASAVGSALAAWLLQVWHVKRSYAEANVQALQREEARDKEDSP